MLFFATLLSIFIICANPLEQTPEKWIDKKIDAKDRAEMAELISYAPIPLGDKLSWHLQEGEEPPNWESLLGKVVIVQSFTNASSDARMAVSTVTKTLKYTKNSDDVALVLIHTPEDYEKATAYCERKRIKAPTIIDSTGAICNTIGFYKEPSNILIDKNGRVRHVGLRVKSMTEAVNALLEEPYDSELKAEAFPLPKNIERTPVVFPKHNNETGVSHQSLRHAKDIQGKSAPEFVIDEWVSNPVDVNGKVRLIEFWATWCGPCVVGIPHLNELAAEFKDDLIVVGVTDEPPSKIRTFMQSTPMNYYVASDSQSRMKSLIKIMGIPHAILVSSEGIVRWQGHPHNLTSEQIKEIIRIDREAGLPVTDRGRWGKPLVGKDD